MRKLFIPGNVRSNFDVYSYRVGVRGLIICLLALSARIASAQSPGELNQKFQAMEDRIKALESEVSALKAALGSQPAAPEAPAAPAAQALAAPQSAGSSAGISDATGRLMNPAMSVIGNLLGAAGHNPAESRSSIEMAESEVAFSAAVDPYARADVFLSFGESGVEVEEAYMTFTSLPAGLLLKAGRMRAQFGKVNAWHRHVVPWVDRPLVTNYLVGGEDGIRDSGFSLSRLLPSFGGVYLDATAELYRGDSGELFQHRTRNDLTTVGRLRAYRDITESTNIDMGFSFARGHYADPSFSIDPGNPGGNFLVNRIYGMDATLRWKPLRRSIYHSFVARTELVWNHRQEPAALRKSFGYYASADYQLARRWFTGVRFDQSDRLFGVPANDTQQSAVITYWPSEFSQIRTQYRHGNYTGIGSANELLFQFQFSIGSHGAHSF